MQLLSFAERERVAETVAAVERHTDAEIVTVLARRADEYRWIMLLWAAVAALLLPGAIVFFPAWFDVRTLLLLQWGCFIVLALVFRIPAVTTRLVPRGLRHARAASLARDQFLAQNLHRTPAATGVLIFVSEAERYVEILVDNGVAKRIENDAWQAIVARFTNQVHAGRTLDGFIECIEACGTRLAEVLPASSSRNTLPNRLVVIDN